MQSQRAQLRGQSGDDATPPRWGGGPAGCPPLILTNGPCANFLDSTRGSLHAAHHITARGEAQNAPDRWNPRDAPSVSLSPAGLPQEQTTRWCDGPGRPHGEVRWLDARSLLVSCKTCTHETVLNIDSLPDTVPLSWFAESFVCKHCDTVDAYISPSWS